MEVFSAVRLGVKPEINAIASLILLSVSLFTFLAWYFTRQAEERRKRAIQQAMEAMAQKRPAPTGSRPRPRKAVAAPRERPPSGGFFMAAKCGCYHFLPG